MSDVSRVQFKDRTLTDAIRQNPVDEFQLRARRRNFWILLVAVLAVAVIVLRRWLS